MYVEYCDIKDGALESYNSLHIRANRSIKVTFYTMLNDYIIHEDHTLSEGICIYTSFILMLIKKGENFNFLIEPLKEKLKKITDEQLQKEIEDPNDIKLLKEDLEKLSPYLQ